MSRKLMDIRIDRISLVDKAATRFKFYIVKRRSDMDEVLKELQKLIKEEFADELEKKDPKDAIQDALKTFCKYWADLPKAMKSAVSSLAEAVDYGHLKKEGEKEAQEEEAEEEGEEEEEEKLEKESLEARVIALEEKSKDATKVEGSKEEDKVDSSNEVIEITDELIDRIKSEYNLMTEDEVLATVEEELKAYFEGSD